MILNLYERVAVAINEDECEFGTVTGLHDDLVRVRGETTRTEYWIERGYVISEAKHARAFGRYFEAKTVDPFERVIKSIFGDNVSLEDIVKKYGEKNENNHFCSRCNSAIDSTEMYAVIKENIYICEECVDNPDWR